MNKNKGFVVLNGSAANLEQKTVIVLGAERGGTSMVAGTLAKLGVYMGEQLRAIYQDKVLAQCIKDKDKHRAKQVIATRNAQYPFWGTKNNFPRLGTWLLLFRERVYVLVFRDIFATANRRVVSSNLHLLPEMFRVLGFNLLLLILLCFSKRPILLVSYEKALSFPEDFVNELSAFLGIDNQLTFSQAVEFIKPTPSDYTHINNYPCLANGQLDGEGSYFGFVDRAQTTQVSGWVLSTHDKSSLHVTLFVNGISVKTVLANLPRRDVAQENLRFHESCGFTFKLSLEQRLKKGDFIEVKLSKKNIHLAKSPQQFV
jgi:hypothetical protein